MPKIIFVSGACGSGKTTFSELMARRTANEAGRFAYIIHGDDFHRGFIEPERASEPEDNDSFFKGGQPSDTVLWEDILRFNWDCIISTAERALKDGLDVVIDYVIENELPRVKQLADKHGAELYYIVLTADAAELEKRIRSRGDTDMIERALFLKKELESAPSNKGHILDTTDRAPADIVWGTDIAGFRV